MSDWQFNAKLLAKEVSRKAHAEDLSTYKVAAHTGVTPTTIQRIMKGYAPDVRTFVRLCQWLGTTLDTYVSR